MSIQSINDRIRFSTEGSLEKCVSFFEDTINKGKGELYGIITNAIGQESHIDEFHTSRERFIGGDPIVHVTYSKKNGSTFHLYIAWESDHWGVVVNQSTDSLTPSMQSYGRSIDGLPITNEGDSPYPIHESPIEGNSPYPVPEQLGG